MKLGIKGKFLLPTIILVIAGMTISTIVSYSITSDSLYKAAIEQIKQVTDSTATIIKSWIERNKLDVENWAELDMVQNSLQDNFMGKSARKITSVHLAKLQKDYKIYESINLSDADGNVIASSDETNVGNINLGDRGYFKESMNGNIIFSDVILSKKSGNPVFAISAPVTDKKLKKISGVILAVVDMSLFSAQFIDNITVGETGYAYIVDRNGMVIAHKDKAHIMKTDMNKFDFGQEMLNKKNGVIHYEYDGIGKYAAFKEDPGLNWIVAATAPTEEVLAASREIRNLMIIIGAVVTLIFGAGLFWMLNSIIIKPVTKVGEFAGELQQGNLDVQLKTGHDEIGKMGLALNAVVQELKSKADAADGIARGDLIQRINVASEKDRLGSALHNMVNSLKEIMSDLSLASDQVAAGSAQVSESSQSLSQGATEQAASLEEITSSMTEIGAQTKTNAENASQANQLSQTAREASDNGVKQMENMIEAMDSINVASNEVAKIIKTIDEIAFQTNLLALNAAVEAARAGKHGKGFAVVAQEVRSLAARSGKAAQETNELIENSIKKVDMGNEIAQKTNTALNEINQSITRVTDLVGEIAAASNEQAQGISQVNTGLSQIDSVTQQNSANAEETSAAAVELNSQAASVKKILSRFKIGKDTSGTRHGNSKPEQHAPETRLLQNSPGDQWGVKTVPSTADAGQVISLDDADFGKY